MTLPLASVSPRSLRETLQSAGEFALLDVREQEEFSREHVLLACCAPLSRLESLAPPLVPCRRTPVFVMDGGDDGLDRAARAAGTLRAMGYSDVRVLEGGLPAWKADGGVTVNGVGALSKGFGEYVESAQETPRLTPEEVRALLDDPSVPTIVIDVRPQAEYRRMNIPGSVNLPGCEVTYRLAEVVTDPDTAIIINCAGRTRSIIGTQTLLNAGIPNRVAALKGGTMNWQLAGFELEYGAERPVPPSTPEGRKAAAERIARVAERYGVRFADAGEVARWQAEAGERTLYFFDVRLPGEYEAGHLPGSRSAQGGQLVQATDEYAAVRNGRYVLADDDELRAIMTAHWLGQMGLPHVFVLRGGIAEAAPVLAPEGLERGPEPAPELPLPPDTGADGTPLTPEALRRLLGEKPSPLLLNVGASDRHRGRHIPGARWIARAWLPRAAARFPEAERIVLTAEDGAHAALAAADARRLWPGARVDALAGGTPAWEAAGLPLETGMPCALCPEDDIWYRPYTDINASREAMRGYFDWESGLVEKIRADGCASFHVRPAGCAR